MNYAEIKEKICRLVDVNCDIANFKKIADKLFLIEGVHSETGVEVTYLVCDCHEKDEFDYNEYAKVLETLDAGVGKLLIFKDLDHEWSIREKLTKQYKAKGKKNINIWFDEIISFYTEQKEEIEISVDDGINYLEYTNGHEIQLEGHVYNVSYYELKKVLNVTGKKLFDKNVRLGITAPRHGTRDNLRVAFDKYVRVGIYAAIQELDLDEEKKFNALEFLEVSEEDLKDYLPCNFWFYHNGVTIVSYDGKMSRFSNKVKMSPANISIINGAQTLSNLYTVMREYTNKADYWAKMIGIERIDSAWIRNEVEKICKNIQFKTIFINASDEYVGKISEGLNTQIPIEEEDRLAVSDVVNKLNKKLKKYHISINRVGEVTNGKNLTVIEFIKKYLIIVGRPGESKNLNRRTIKRQLEESLKVFSSDENIEKLSLVIDLDMWWEETWKKNLLDVYEDEKRKIYWKYGKNYFQAFVIKESQKYFDDEHMYVLFARFVETFEKLTNAITMEDFKKNSLFDKYLEDKRQKENEKIETSEAKINTEELCNYINDSKIKSKNSRTIAITEYLNEKGITISYFRTVTIMENERIKEHFSFPSSTFNQLYLDKKEGESVSNVEYEQSIFHSEVERVYPLFCIFINQESDVERIEIIPNFTFSSFHSEAKMVFEKTKLAFQEGDISLFPTVSDGVSFHVRPHAMNKEDVFEFSDGTAITKRTFWVNRETVNQEIFNHVKK